MRRFLKILALALGAMFFLASPLSAQTLEQAMADYKAGNYHQAVENWQALAEAGDADALFNLGQVYRLGNGISFDFPKAEANYLRAAEAGHTAAQRELGNLYFFTIGTDEAQAQAIPWWQKAAENGDAKAQYILGILYFNGDVVAKDRILGYAWTLLAMDGGVPEALQSNTAMRSQLSEENLASALSLAPTLMTGAPKQGFYSTLIGEPFPRPRSIIGTIKVAGSEPETDAIEEAPVQEIEGEIEKPKDPPPALVLRENSISAEDQPLEPLEEAVGPNSEPALEAGPPERQEAAAADNLTAGDSEQEAAVKPEPDPEFVPVDEYDLGDPASPLVDQQGFDGAWSIQLTSFRRPENAEAHWQEVSSAHPELFSPVTKKILRFDLGPEMGVYYRLRIGPFLDKTEADAKCQEITEAGLGCLVIWP